uniref:Secreted protein n=1 Tax=Cucumis melo TaxID=3656 RepID=A0A9I9ECA6_CUCME
MVFSITAFIAKVVVIFALLLHVSFNVSAMNVVETNRAARIAIKICEGQWSVQPTTQMIFWEGSLYWSHTKMKRSNIVRSGVGRLVTGKKTPRREKRI